MSANHAEYERLCRDFCWASPSEYNVGEIIARGGSSDAGNVALVVADGDRIERTYSFAELDRYSSQMANLFAARGHQQGDAIAVMLPQSFEAAIAYLAILKSGMLCVPMIPELATTSFIERLGDARASGLVTSHAVLEAHGKRLEGLPQLRATYPVMEQGAAPEPTKLEALIAAASPAFAAPQLPASAPAFLSFTSGSEGKPKGVMHAQRLLDGIVPIFNFTGQASAADRTWSHFEWGWLGGVLVALGAWHQGSAVIIDRQAQPVSPATLRLLTNTGASRVSLSPTALRMLKIGTRDAQFPQLRSIASGGEKLDGDTRDWTQQRFGIELSEIYGLSEASGVLGCGHVLEARENALGKPVPGQTVAILGDNGEEVERGERGMIAIKGPHPAMFLGYLDDEEATRAKFSGKYLLTGDVGFQDEDGYFYYAGRGDDLIKVGGRRIGPGEIEQALNSLPQVDDSAVVGVPDRLSGHRLVAWVQLPEGQEVSRECEESILRALRSKLPSYQVPHRIHMVRDLPKTSNGKVSRRLVREAELGGSQ